MNERKLNKLKEKISQKFRKSKYNKKATNFLTLGVNVNKKIPMLEEDSGSFMGFVNGYEIIMHIAPDDSESPYFALSCLIWVENNFYQIKKTVAIDLKESSEFMQLLRSCGWYKSFKDFKFERLLGTFLSVEITFDEVKRDFVIRGVSKI